jgi:hypothetical protein
MARFWDSADDVDIQAPWPNAKLAGWRPALGNYSGALVGYAAISFNGIVIQNIPVFRDESGAWTVGQPATVQVDADGRVRLRPDGKRKYDYLVTFETREARETWRSMVLRAMAAAGVRNGP